MLKSGFVGHSPMAVLPLIGLFAKSLMHKIAGTKMEVFLCMKARSRIGPQAF